LNPLDFCMLLLFAQVDLQPLSLLCNWQESWHSIAGTLHVLYNISDCLQIDTVHVQIEKEMLRLRVHKHGRKEISTSTVLQVSKSFESFLLATHESWRRRRNAKN
jgi:hypothetical protein